MLCKFEYLLFYATPTQTINVCMVSKLEFALSGMRQVLDVDIEMQRCSLNIIHQTYWMLAFNSYININTGTLSLVWLFVCVRLL